MNEQPDPISIPVVREELHATTREVPTGSVRVVKKVVPHEEVLEQELRKDRVEVRRVQINRPVDEPQQVRESGNTTIIPVVEEQLHITRVLVLKEEIHITRYSETEVHRETVTLRQETATVEKLDASGNAVVDPVADTGVDPQLYPPQTPQPDTRTHGAGLGGRSILDTAASAAAGQRPSRTPSILKP